MIISLICLIFSLLGIYGYFNDLYILTYIGFIFVLFQEVFGKLSGQSKTMEFFLIACFIGCVITKKFLIGISIGACFENTIFTILGLIFMLYLYFLEKK